MSTEFTDTTTIEVTINGEMTVDEVPARLFLSEYLRDYRYLTGTHRGCETAKCGACTILVDGDAVKSCNMLAAQVDGSEVTTIEGLDDDGDLHPVQSSFWNEHGSQCGYCTPGFVLASIDMLEENPDPSVDEIRETLTGNICRCTGYTKIVESIQDAAADYPNPSD